MNEITDSDRARIEWCVAQINDIAALGDLY